MKQIAIAIFSLNTYQSARYRMKIPVASGRATIILLLLILFLAEILCVYLVMPFPGSQRFETVGIAYWLSRYIIWIRIAVLLAVAVALVKVFRTGKTWEKITLPIVLAGYAVIFGLSNFQLNATSIFHKPTVTSFTPAVESVDKSKLVIGVVVNGEAKAYPVQLIGYHHQVADTVGKEPVIVTYCTVCRTGRVYSSLVNGHHDSFRLVGMDHFNAVFEDQSTKSWWQQATGEAIAGPMKGSKLKEISSRQLTIDAWLRQYPQSVVMAPDTLYDERYFRLEDYDRGTMQSPLVRRDQRSWQSKSWIVGVKNENASMAYDWNELVQKRIIQDSIQSLPILVAMENDTTSFHVYDRRVNGTILQFDSVSADNKFKDRNTKSTWTMDGICIEGQLTGTKLGTIQAYNEFWHSWSTFQPNVKRYTDRKK